MIERYIHQISDTYKDSWCKRGWEYKLWTEDDIRSLLLHNYPYLIDHYNRSTKYAREALASYAILHTFGGIYVDGRLECIGDIDDLLTADLVVLDGIIGCIKGHLLLEECVKYYKNRHYDSYQRSDILIGSIFFNRRLTDYIRRYGSKDITFYNVASYAIFRGEKNKYSYSLSGYNIAAIVLLFIVMILVVVLFSYFC